MKSCGWIGTSIGSLSTLSGWIVGSLLRASTKLQLVWLGHQRKPSWFCPVDLGCRCEQPHNNIFLFFERKWNNKHSFRSSHRQSKNSPTWIAWHQLSRQRCLTSLIPSLHDERYNTNGTIDTVPKNDGSSPVSSPQCNKTTASRSTTMELLGAFTRTYAWANRWLTVLDSRYALG